MEIQLAIAKPLPENLMFFFSSVASNLERNIPHSPLSPTAYVQSVENTMFLSPTTPFECETVISQLKLVKYDIDTFPVSLFKKFKNILSTPISILVNKSFLLGSFPTSLKTAKITPIFKSGDPKNIKNFRPISILPFLSKIFEKIFSIRLLSFANKYSIFTEKQFGFLPKKNTFDAIFNLVEYIYNGINSRNSTIALFLDLSRAFDTVNHMILKQKLLLYGIRGNSFDFISSYLENRKQCVRKGKNLSSQVVTNIGIGQGTLLGPILFLLYVNDLPNISNNIEILLYADDTAIYKSYNNINNVIPHFNTELDLFKNWFFANRISVNFDKTSAMNFSLSRLPFNDTILFNNLNINFVDNYKYLGVIFDSKLIFKNHIYYISDKISKIVGLFYKIFPDIPYEVRLNLYYSLFYPYLLYCNIIWGGAADTHLNKIFLLQKKVIRLICSEPYLSHTNNLFFKSKILKVHDVYKFMLCLYFHQNRTSFHSFSHSHFTRNRNQIVPEFERLTLSQRSVYYACPIAWNDLPEYLKNIRSYSNFKFNLKNFLVSKYTPSS